MPGEKIFPQFFRITSILTHLSSSVNNYFSPLAAKGSHFYSNTSTPTCQAQILKNFFSVHHFHCITSAALCQTLFSASFCSLLLDKRTFVRQCLQASHFYSTTFLAPCQLSDCTNFFLAFWAFCLLTAAEFFVIIFMSHALNPNQGFDGSYEQMFVAENNELFVLPANICSFSVRRLSLLFYHFWLPVSIADCTNFSNYFCADCTIDNRRILCYNGILGNCECLQFVHTLFTFCACLSFIQIFALTGRARASALFLWRFVGGLHWHPTPRVFASADIPTNIFSAQMGGGFLGFLKIFL